MRHPEITEEEEFPRLYTLAALNAAVAKAVDKERRRCEKIAKEAGIQAFLNKRFTPDPAIRATLSAQKEIAERIVRDIRKGK